MADSNINQSNVLTNSSVASLETAVRTSIFRDVSREHEFEAYLQHGIVLCDASRKKEFDRCLQEHPQDELNRWIGFFRFMPNDDGGIMSHINTLMEQAHGRLVHEWKHVGGHTHQLKQLIANVKQFRKLCKDFRIQDYEYECSTSNFLVEKPCGLMMNEHAFFMTSRMMDKLRICQDNYTVKELDHKYVHLENFLLGNGGHFDDIFILGSTEVHVKSFENPTMSLGKTVNIQVESKSSGSFTRVVSCKPRLELNCDFNRIYEELQVPDSKKIANRDEIKFMGGVLSCLKQMSNYKGYEAQFGVIDKLYNVGCDNFIVAKSPTIREIIQMQHPHDMVLVDLTKLKDVPLIFGVSFTTEEIP